MHQAAVAVWAVLLVAAFFYTRRFRNPNTPMLAAFLIFVTVFTASAFVLFAAISWMLYRMGQADAIAGFWGALAFLVAVFVPAFLIARWQLRKPPRQRMPS